jgi:hypothetical protein
LSLSLGSTFLVPKVQAPPGMRYNETASKWSPKSRGREQAYIAGYFAASPRSSTISNLGSDHAEMFVAGCRFVYLEPGGRDGLFGVEWTRRSSRPPPCTPSCRRTRNKACWWSTRGSSALCRARACCRGMRRAPHCRPGPPPRIHSSSLLCLLRLGPAAAAATAAAVRVGPERSLSLAERVKSGVAPGNVCLEAVVSHLCCDGGDGREASRFN